MNFDALFGLAPAGPGAWTAPGAPPTDEPLPYGGLLVGQAVAAAVAEAGRCHAIHLFFLGAGRSADPFDVTAERTREGRSFRVRRVEIRQGGRLLLAGCSSHHEGEAGPEHQAAMPDLPPPETLEDQRELRARRARQAGAQPRRLLAETLLDIRPAAMPEADAPRRAIWFRPRAPVAGGLAVHQAAIGFASDFGLVYVGLMRRRQADRAPVQGASLDHALWFHREARADGWMLHVQDSPVAAMGRGFARGSVFTRDGTLVASVAQEFLARGSASPPKVQEAP